MKQIIKLNKLKSKSKLIPINLRKKKTSLKIFNQIMSLKLLIK